MRSSLEIDALAFPQPAEQMHFTGERYTQGITGPIRHQHHHRYLFAASFCVDRDVLDIACGEGYGSALLATVGRSVRGIDLDAEAVAFAERNYAVPNLSFQQGNAAHLEEPGAFDVVVSFETIEHLVEHDAFIEGVRRTLRPRGLLIISSPDKAIYTGADQYKNAFHLRELDRIEFSDLLKKYFRYVTVFEQDSIAGSLIGAAGGASAPLQVFSTENGRTYRRSKGAPNAHYLLALASDAPLPAATASALHDASWIREAGDNEIQAVALGREVVIRDAEIGRLNQALTQQSQTLEQQSQALARWSQLSAQQCEELARATLKSRRATEALSLAQAEVSDLRREAEHMQALIDERTRQLADVFASTSWRLSAPIRWFGLTTAMMRRRMRAALSTAAVPASAARPLDGGTRVLFVDWGVPTPDQDSGSMDLWHQLGLFQSLGFDVAFMPVVERQSDTRYLDALRQAGIRLLMGSAGVSPELVLQDKAAGFDMIFLNRIHVAARLLLQVRRCAPNARVVFNTVDLHFLREEREAAHEGSEEKARAAAQRRKDELKCVAEADATIVLSDAEGRLLSDLVPGAPVHVIPFARATADVVPSFCNRNGVLFVGGFLHSPNIDAAHWLVTEIWPKVRRALPTARLEIVGSNAPPDIRKLNAPDSDVHMRGFVQDLDAALARVRLTVAPLRFGAGIKGKVAMSLAAGVPCVATSIAAEGMGAVDGDSILVGETAEELAAAIVRVHEDAEYWTRLSQGGQVMMRERYSFERTGQLLLNLTRSMGVAVPADVEHKLAELKPLEWPF